MELTDRAALLAAIDGTPLNSTVRRVYADLLDDLAAKAQRIHARLLGEEAAEHRGIAAWLEAGHTLTGRQEAKVRRVAGESRCPVVVVPGDSAPRARGERAYSEFRGGGRCKWPGAAIKAGYKVDYVASTKRIEVGVLWLLAQGYWR